MNPSYQITFPGQRVKEWLYEHNMTQQEAANIIDMPYHLLREICMGTTLITGYAANKLGLLTGIAPDVWLTMDQTYRNNTTVGDTKSRG